MNIRRTVFFVALAAFALGFWTACTIGFDPTDTETGLFSCTDNTDCLSPNTCKGGVCTPPSGGTACVDADDDGFGVGETGDCEKCLEFGQCEEDCNDNDPAIAPDLRDTCDGKDNNCNDEVDEPLSCESSIDCPEEAGTIPTCENMMCVYRPPNQLGEECSGVTLSCVNGEREDPPAACQ